MDNARALNMIETMCMGRVDWCDRFVGYGSMTNVVKDKILNDWIKSDFFDLESELRYLSKLAKMQKIGIDSYLLSTMLSTDIMTNNPIGMRSLYNIMTMDKNKLKKYIKLNEEDDKDLWKEISKHWTWVRDKEKSVNIIGSTGTSIILESLNSRFGIFYEQVFFLGIDLTRDKMYVCILGNDNGDVFALYEAQNELMEFKQRFARKELNKLSDNIDFNFVSKTFKVQDLDMLFI